MVDSIDTTNEISCKIDVNNHKVPMKIDSGAKCNVMSNSVFNKIRSTKLIDGQKQTHLVAYGGDKVPTLGTVTLSGCLQDHRDKFNIVFHVVDKPVATILGLKDALNLKLLTLHPAVYELKEDDTPDTPFAHNIKQEFKSLFNNKLGTLPLMYKMK